MSDRTVTVPAWNDPPGEDRQRILTRLVADHPDVVSVTRRDANRYTLQRRNAGVRQVYLTPVRLLTQTDYLALRAHHPEVELIILASASNVCKMEVKERALSDGVAIHCFRTLIGALSMPDELLLTYQHKSPQASARSPSYWPYWITEPLLPPWAR